MTKSTKQKIAVFEVVFNPKTMCDEETIQKEYGGSWLKLMKYLVKEEGACGIFDKPFKLIEIKDKRL